MKKLTIQKNLIILILIFFCLSIRCGSRQLNQAKGIISLMQLSSSSSIITILSPKNITYADVDIPFNCQYNTELFIVSYNLDESQNIPFEKDKILTDLSAGEHRLEVVVQSLDGNIEASENIIFTIKPNPSFLVIISLSLVGIIGLFFIIRAIRQKN